jgi:hypothetical protein
MVRNSIKKKNETMNNTMKIYRIRLKIYLTMAVPPIDYVKSPRRTSSAGTKR